MSQLLAAVFNIAFYILTDLATPGKREDNVYSFYYDITQQVSCVLLVPKPLSVENVYT